MEVQNVETVEIMDNPTLQQSLLQAAAQRDIISIQVRYQSISFFFFIPSVKESLLIKENFFCDVMSSVCLILIWLNNDSLFPFKFPVDQDFTILEKDKKKKNWLPVNFEVSDEILCKAVYRRLV